MPIAGTFLLDGLLQGTSPGEEDLRRWVAEAARAGLNFSLEMEGSRFSLLADHNTYPISRLHGVGLDIAMTGLLESLLALYPAKRATLYSTLRSQEYRPGKEVQCVYVIAADGNVQVQSREVAADVPIPIPPTRRQRMVQSLIVLVALLLMAVFVTQFLDLRHLFHRVRAASQPNQGVELEAKGLSPYVETKLAKVRQLDGFVELEFSRGEKWDAAKPGDLEEPVMGPGAPARSWHDFLAIEAVKRSAVRCAFFDEKGLFVGEAPVNLDALKDTKSFTTQVAIPKGENDLKRIVVRP